MNEISIINKSTLLGREINIYGTPDEPMFLAKDVARMDRTHTTLKDG